jgi:cytochrome c peroxidase
MQAMKWLVLAALVAIPLGLEPRMPVPEGNPITSEKVDLGRRLFGDRRLSRDGTIACTSCHDPQRAFSAPDAVSPGVDGRRGRRNAPALVNLAWSRGLFWDARVASLEEQVLKPIEDQNEMDLPLADASARVGVPPAMLAQALATYVRTLLSGDSAYDRYVNGDRSALSPDEQLGLRVFQGRGNCTFCHVGSNFTDDRVHNTGIAWVPADDLRGVPGRFLDEGRGAISGLASERGAFKTPTLREVARTGPYMHDGSLASLEEVVDYYNRGGRPNPALDPDVHPLDLTDDAKRGLVAFLRALSGRSMPASSETR